MMVSGRLNELGREVGQTICGGPRAPSVRRSAVDGTVVRSWLERMAMRAGAYSAVTLDTVGGSPAAQAPLRHIAAQWVGAASSDCWASPDATVRHSASDGSTRWPAAVAVPAQAPSNA